MNVDPGEVGPELRRRGLVRGPRRAVDRPDRLDLVVRRCVRRACRGPGAVRAGTGTDWPWRRGSRTRSSDPSPCHTSGASATSPRASSPGTPGRICTPRRSPGAPGWRHRSPGRRPPPGPGSGGRGSYRASPPAPRRTPLPGWDRRPQDSSAAPATAAASERPRRLHLNPPVRLALMVDRVHGVINRELDHCQVPRGERWVRASGPDRVECGGIPVDEDIPSDDAQVRRGRPPPRSRNDVERRWASERRRRTGNPRRRRPSSPPSPTHPPFARSSPSPRGSSSPRRRPRAGRPRRCRPGPTSGTVRR